MLRLVLLPFALLLLTAFHSEDPFSYDRPFAFNTVEKGFFLAGERTAPDFSDEAEIPVDSTVAARILLFNYSAYDSAYIYSIRSAVQNKFPACSLTDFWDGSGEDLVAALNLSDLVIIPYPYKGAPPLLQGYGKILRQFVSQGGNVILTGTHEYAVLQHFDLFDLDFGYYCANLNLEVGRPDHPVTQGIGKETAIPDFAYPLDISDPQFVTLGSIRDYPAIGYKPLGAGKIVYLGLEYYRQEINASRIFLNTVQWLSPVKTVPVQQQASAPVSAPTVKGIKRSEEQLTSGSRSMKSLAFNIYPNPYTDKATLDFEIEKQSTVGIEITNETGNPVAVLLTRRNLSPGIYRFDMPAALAPGIYFVACQTGELKTVKKVVKLARQ